MNDINNGGDNNVLINKNYVIFESIVNIYFIIIIFKNIQLCSYTPTGSDLSLSLISSDINLNNRIFYFYSKRIILQ